MSIKSITRLFFVLCALAVLPFALSACDTADADGDDSAIDHSPPISEPVGPPRVEAEIIPVIPDPQAEIWRPGYWALKAGQFVWIPGKVIPRPSPTAVWATSHWVHHTYGWSFDKGHWE